MTLKHILLYFVLTCCSVFTGLSSAAITAKIVGGQKSLNNQWPWMIALVKNGTDNYSGQFCGGGLINPSWVITAAHCLEQKKPTEIHVVYNALNLKTNRGQSIPVKRIFLHPQFNPQTVNNDIALIQLKTPVKNPVSLPLIAGNSTLVNAKASVIGWGALSEWDSEFSIYPEQLYHATVPIISNAQCKKAYSADEITDTMLCAGSAAAITDTCTGDSGGPLVIRQNSKWHLAGITSWGNGCATPGFYGVYTRVSKYVSYINSTLKTNYFALADTNHDKAVNDLDKARKYSDLKLVFKKWVQQCWDKKASCADITKNGVVNTYDYTVRNKQIDSGYKYWLNLYWQPESANK